MPSKRLHLKKAITTVIRIIFGVKLPVRINPVSSVLAEGGDRREADITILAHIDLRSDSEMVIQEMTDRFNEGRFKKRVAHVL